MMAARRTEVRLETLNTPTPNPDAVKIARSRLEGVPAAIVDVRDVADVALWFWTNNDGGTGTLIAFKGGTTELVFTIVGVSEGDALAGAKKLAARALGGAGGTGYAYRATATETAKSGASETTCPRKDPCFISECFSAVKALGDSGVMGDSQHPAQRDMGGPAIAELANARARFWATYPGGGPAHKADAEELRKALSAVDFTYLYFHFYSLDMGAPADGAGQLRQNLFQGIAGVPPEETVIHERALKQFDAWKLAVYNRLNGGFSDILKIQARLPQALNETEMQYERYRTARDNAECLRAGQTAERGKSREEMQAEEAVQEKARAGASVRQNVCISDDLTTEWKNPSAGGKMESLKRLLIQSLRERAKSPGYDQTRWIAVDSRYYSAWNPDTSSGWSALVSTIPGGSCAGAGHREILELSP
jgi:hypothetical protein